MKTQADQPPIDADGGSPGVFYDDTELISTRTYKAGYQVRTERRRYGCGNSDGSPPEWFTVRSYAASPRVQVIGDGH